MPNRMTHSHRGWRWWPLLLIPILALIGIANGSAAPPAPDPIIQGTIKLTPEAFWVPEPSLPSLRSQQASAPKLDSAIEALISSPPLVMQERAKALGLRLSGDRVHVHVVIQASAIGAVREAIAGAGGEVTKASSDETLLQGWLPIDAILSLSAREDVYLVLRPAQAILLEEALAGGATTEGLTALNAPTWHAAGRRGAGVKVGIIDSGFQGYTALLGADLPATVTARNFVDGEADYLVDGTTRHGTSCAEIVHDVAPDASLYLAKISTSLDLQEAVSWLRDTHRVNVISTSLGWYNVTPGDGTGQFADLVQNARSAGILWATAAGNDRESHWGGAFKDANGNSIHEFNAKEINCFGPGGDQCYQLNPGFLFQVYLRWDDWTSVNQDYDLYLLRYNGSGWDIIGSSTNMQSGLPGQRPIEAATVATYGSATSYGFYIRRINSTRNVNLEVFAPKLTRLNELVTARSLANLADAPAAMTVAALDVNSPYPQEVYSSEGPTNGPGGTAMGGAIKPDIAAYANVSTVSYGPRGFNGTSAATPHVAGAAALVLSANPMLTPAQVQSFLEQRAIDMGAAGKDTVYGWGRLYLGAPLAGEPPQVTGIMPSSGANNRTVQITNLAGEHFQNGAKVKLARSGYPDIQAANVVVVSENRITCEFDLNGAATGAWNVVVTNPDTLSGTLPNGFTVLGPAPTVSSITPNVGLYTGWALNLDVAGSHFQPGATVKLQKSNHPDLQAANVRWMSANRLICDVNLSGVANGFWDVVVTNPDGQSGVRTEGFYVNAPGSAPRISSVSPSKGDNTGIVSPFTVVGSQFTSGSTQPAIRLTRLGQPAIVATNVSVVDSRTITCRLNLTGVSAGPWNVTVTNPNGEYWTLTNGFSITGHIYLPVIARLCPAPVLAPIDNADGDGSYTLSWSLAPCGTTPSSWELQYDTDPTLSSPTTIVISDPGQTSYAASTPALGTYYWHVRAPHSGQGWTGWSNVQSVTVSRLLAEVWINNETGGPLTVEIVGVETKSFPTGIHFWRTVTPGRYTLKAWGCGNPTPVELPWEFEAGKNTIIFRCASTAAPQSQNSTIELQVTPG